MLKDLTAYLAQPLVLPWRDKEFTVAPPSKAVGVKLAAINAVGVATYAAMLEECPTCGRAGTVEVPEETRRVADSLEKVDLADLSLGKIAHRAMVKAGIPQPDIDLFALYALYYWTVGEEIADQIIAARYGAPTEQPPKA